MYKFMRFFLIALFSLTMMTDCNKTNVSPPRPTPIVVDTNYCKDAEVHLLELKCAVGQPTKKGVPFEEFCKQTQNAGIFINPKCLSTVATCEAVDICTGSK